MQDKKEPHQLENGFTIESTVSPWMFRQEPERLIGVSFQMSAVKCESSVCYKVRAHGVKDESAKRLVKNSGSGMVKAHDFESVFVQFPLRCLQKIRLTVSIDGIEYPIHIEVNENFWTPPEKRNRELTNLMTPLRVGLSAHPTPMRSLGRSVARVFNSLKNYPSPIRIDHRYITPRVPRHSTPIRPPRFDGTPTLSNFTFSSASTDSLPGVTDEHIQMLDQLFPRAGGVSRDDLWMLVHYFVMDVFVSMGHCAREWFMTGGPDVDYHPNESTSSLSSREMSLECLVVTLLIDYLQKFLVDLELSHRIDSIKSPQRLDPIQNQDWFNQM